MMTVSDISTTYTPRIMIVDDTPENLTLLRDIFMEKGYDVMALPSGGLALKAAEKSPPDLILLDVRMPEMNGYEVCKLLKQNPRLQHIPVIFLSALVSEEDRVEAFCAGAAGYIVKPFTVEEVQARVAAHLTGRVPLPKDGDGPAEASRTAPSGKDSASDIVVEAAVALPTDVPGVDVTAGLSVVGGKPAVYRELLRRFVAGRGETVGEIKRAIEQQEFEVAARTVHSMISVTAMLGATRASAAAVALEKELDTENFSERTLTAFTEEFSLVYTGLRSWLTKTRENEGGAPQRRVETAAVLRIVAELEMLLETDVGQVLDLREDLREHLVATPFADRFGEFESQFDRFDLEGAAATLRSLAYELQRDSGG